MKLDGKKGNRVTSGHVVPILFVLFLPVVVCLVIILFGGLEALLVAELLVFACMLMLFLLLAYRRALLYFLRGGKLTYRIHATSGPHIDFRELYCDEYNAGSIERAVIGSLKDIKRGGVWKEAIEIFSTTPKRNASLHEIESFHSGNNASYLGSLFGDAFVAKNNNKARRIFIQMKDGSYRFVQIHHMARGRTLRAFLKECREKGIPCENRLKLFSDLPQGFLFGGIVVGWIVILVFIFWLLW